MSNLALFCLGLVSMVMLTGATTGEATDPVVSVPLMAVLLFVGKTLWDLHAHAAESKVRHDAQERRLDAQDAMLKEIRDCLGGRMTTDVEDDDGALG